MRRADMNMGRRLLACRSISEGGREENFSGTSWAGAQSSVDVQVMHTHMSAACEGVATLMRGEHGINWR
jgi:hypothetical protein